ncbi:MAG: hypothetical protein ACRDZ8_15505 [Acidimicrobiales bacterium]
MGAPPALKKQATDPGAAGASRARDQPSPLVCLGLALVGLVLLVLRRPDVLGSPKLWAEDGAVYMNDAFLRHGYQTFLAPYNGTVYLIPRLWAFATTALPVARLPLSYALFALVFDVACLAIVLSRRFAWLIPSFWVRAALFLVLILLPGTWEIYGNLTNSIWYAGLCLLLLSFATDPRSKRGAVAEVVVAVLLALTTAVSIIVAPLYLLRWWRTRSRQGVALVIVVGLGGAYQLLETRLHPRVQPSYASVSGWAYIRTMVERVGGTAALGQYRLAAWWPGSHPHRHLAALLLSAVMLAGVALLTWFLPRPAALALAVAMAMSLAAATFGLAIPFSQLGDPQTGGRYFVGPVVILCLALASAVPVALARLPRPVGFVVLVPVAILAFGVVGDARLRPMPAIGWTASARCIASHRQCRVQLDPAAWVVVLPPVSTAH